MLKAEKVIDALTVYLKCTESSVTFSRKYRQFSIPGSNGRQFYFVGKCGALRKGRTISDSVSIDAESFVAKTQQLSAVLYALTWFFLNLGSTFRPAGPIGPGAPVGSD